MVVDVVVHDGKGNPVTDLTRAEVELREDGALQSIASFDLFRVAPASPPPAQAPPPAGPAPVPVSTNAGALDQGGRTFVIVFDDAHLGARGALRAKAAVGEFLKKETREGDRVTLLAASGGVWWTAGMESGRDELLALLKRLEGKLPSGLRRDWVSDYEAMRIHVFHDNAIIDRVQRRFETYGIQTMTAQSQHVRNMMAVEDPVVTTRAIEVYFEAVARNHATLGALERALGALAGVRGRKSLVLVSEGFVYDTQLPEFRRIVDASRRANAAIYFVNARGLEGLPDALTADYSTVLPAEDLGFAFSQEAETQEGSISLAADTGGFTVRNTNDLAAGIRRISDETRAYYLIGYNPTNAARDGAFRRIEVRVKGRRGLSLRARRGYYAPSDAAAAPDVPKGTDAAFQAALDSPYERGELPLRLTHAVREETTLDEARVFLAAEVDVRRLALREENGEARGALEYLMVAAPRDGGAFFRVDQALQLALPPDTRAQLERTWLPMVREFSLHTGRYRAKIVVRDRSTGRIGTVVHDFDVPHLKPFRLSTPVISDVRETAADGAPGDRLAVLARREFPRSGTLYWQVDVYRAVKEEGSGLPKVTLGYEIRRADGALLTREPPTRIVPTTEGALSRMEGLPLARVPAGEYVLQLRAKDEYSGETVEQKAAFSVSDWPEAPGTP